MGRDHVGAMLLPVAEKEPRVSLDFLNGTTASSEASFVDLAV